MQSSENRIIIACAGSGKTSHLVDDALSNTDRRIVIVTYTNNNTREIIKRFGCLNGGVPKHVEVMTWFAFLLRHGTRPYQRCVYAEHRIESLLFVNQQSARGIAENDTKRHYFANGDLIYSDKIAKFVFKCEAECGRRVTSRLRQIYTDIFIDEFQDLAGWDLEVIHMLLQSGIRITLVGDPRQHIYSTNVSQKNKHYLGIKVVGLLEKWKQKGLCRIVPMNGTYRCNQAICDFANRLWPDMDDMAPLTDVKTEHDGVFLVAENAVGDYVERFRSQVLRYDKRAQSYGCVALNFGMSKGLEFERVLVVPTEPIRKYLETGELKHVERSKDKLHVAVTRAKHSVAFVYDGQSPLVQTRFPR